MRAYKVDQPLKIRCHRFLAATSAHSLRVELFDKCRQMRRTGAASASYWSLNDCKIAVSSTGVGFALLEVVQRTTRRRMQWSIRSAAAATLRIALPLEIGLVLPPC